MQEERSENNTKATKITLMLTGVLGHAVSSASANYLLVAEGVGLFGAGVISKQHTKAFIRVSVDMYHKIKKRQAKPHNVVKAGQQKNNE